MGDKGSGAGRLATTVLLGLTVTTAAAIGLVWLYNNRRRQRSPSNSSREVYAQYASEIVQSLENQSSAPIPIKYNNSQNNYTHPRISDPSDTIKTELREPSDTNNISGNIVVAASAKSAAPVLEAAQKLKEDEEEDLVDGEEDERGVDHRNIRNMGEREEDKHVSVECIIPKDSVAGVIGRKGIQIKLIQKDSNTRIHFNNESMALENGDRVCVIRGRADDVAIAGDMIRKFVASQPVTLTKEILVPQQSVGRIIGRQGENIRGMQDVSKAKINIDSGRFESREGDDTVYNVVVLKGNSDQIDQAEALILETVEEEKNFRNNIRGQAASRTMRRANPPPTLSPPPPPRISPTSAQPPLKQSHNLITNGIIQVYVSCVYHPNMFWIQQVGPDSIELDKLGEAMTEYYHKEDQSQGEYDEEFSVGDIVAAPFPLDHKMYRGKVIAKVAAETVEVEYVDYGDRRHVVIKELRTLSPHFLSLKFQAVQASLDLTCPGLKWSDEVITRFCDLSYCAQWKCITGKAKGFSNHPTDNSKQTTLLLELMDEDVNIGEKLIQEGLARHKDDYSHPHSHAQSPSVPMSGSRNESSIESNGVDQ